MLGLRTSITINALDTVEKITSLATEEQEARGQLFLQHNEYDVQRDQLDPIQREAFDKLINLRKKISLLESSQPKNLKEIALKIAISAIKILTAVLPVIGSFVSFRTLVSYSGPIILGSVLLGTVNLIFEKCRTLFFQRKYQNLMNELSQKPGMEKALKNCLEKTDPIERSILSSEETVSRTELEREQNRERLALYQSFLEGMRESVEKPQKPKTFLYDLGDNSTTLRCVDASPESRSAFDYWEKLPKQRQIAKLKETLVPMDKAVSTKRREEMAARKSLAMLLRQHPDRAPIVQRAKERLAKAETELRTEKERHQHLKTGLAQARSALIRA